MAVKLTIVTVNYNDISGLERTIKSVGSQTCDDYEYIVIDGGSTDGSKELLEKTKGLSQWVSEPDKGIYNAMNKGVVMAHGEYILFLNSGDTLYNNKVLEQVYPHLDGGDFYVGHPMLVKGRKKVRENLPAVMTIEFLLLSSINHQSTFTRTAILKESPYNENYKIVADWEKFFTQWLLYDRSYTPLDITIVFFQLDGASSRNKELLWKEKADVFTRLFPPYLLKGLRTEEKLTPIERKLKKALSKPPVKRDCKLLRLAFKLLLKDSIKEVYGFFVRAKYN